MSDAPQSSVRQRRPSAAEAVAHTARHADAKIAESLLVAWDELPHWRRDNAYIKSGYRATSASVARSLASLGYLHNESVNIWSHLLGAAAFALAGALLRSAVVPRYGSASPSDVLVFSCFFGGAFLCLGMSATFHALCNHSLGVATWANKLDYSGIVFLIVGSYVPAMYYGFFCLPKLMAVYLYMISLLGLGCLAVSWLEHFRTPAWRPYRALMFVCLGLSGVVPVIHGAMIYGLRQLDVRMGVRWVILQGALYIFGAFLYAVRWPERQFPGTFDIWGSSHQLFHMCVLLAAASHFYGMRKAFDFHHGVMGAHC